MWLCRYELQTQGKRVIVAFSLSMCVMCSKLWTISVATISHWIEMVQFIKIQFKVTNKVSKQASIIVISIFIQAVNHLLIDILRPMCLHIRTTKQSPSTSPTKNSFLKENVWKKLFENHVCYLKWSFIFVCSIKLSSFRPISYSKAYETIDMNGPEQLIVPIDLNNGWYTWWTNRIVE